MFETFDSLFAHPPTLEGRIVRMEPLAPQHEDGLFEAASDPRMWEWLSSNHGGSRQSFSEWMTTALASRARGVEFPFATVERSSDRAIGSSRYLALRPEHRGLEIGWTFLGPAWWGTGANSEAKLLMLDHAFGPMDCMRVEFKTDAKNERSRAALEAIGARFEGVFRKHMLVRDGELRDSAWYAITDDEWPDVRAHLAARVDAALERSTS